MPQESNTVLTPKGDYYTVPESRGRKWTRPDLFKAVVEFFQRMGRLPTQGEQASCRAEQELAARMYAMALKDDALKAWIDATGMKHTARGLGKTGKHLDPVNIQEQCEATRAHIREHGVLPPTTYTRIGDRRLGTWVSGMLHSKATRGKAAIARAALLKVLEEEGMILSMEGGRLRIFPAAETSSTPKPPANPAPQAPKPVPPTADPEPQAVHGIRPLTCGDVFIITKGLRAEYEGREAVVVDSSMPGTFPYKVEAAVLNSDGSFDTSAPRFTFHQLGNEPDLYGRPLLPTRRMVAKVVWEAPPVPPRGMHDSITLVDSVVHHAMTHKGMRALLVLIPGGLEHLQVDWERIKEAALRADQQ